MHARVTHLATGKFLVVVGWSTNQYIAAPAFNSGSSGSAPPALAGRAFPKAPAARSGVPSSHFFIFDVLILSGRNGRPSSSSAAGVEGLVAKRRNSRYEPGQRSGVWRKMRINRGQKFVIGGYTPRGDPDLAPGHTCAAQPDRDSPRLRASLHVGSSESRLQHQPGAEREPRHWDIPCEAQKHGGR